MEALSADLKRAWETDERVRALKIAIQCSKMLGDSSHPTFFPSCFALISEILDSFGELVYARVVAKGTPRGKTLSADYGPRDVAEEGIETTKNWFFKARHSDSAPAIREAPTLLPFRAP